MKNVVLLFFVVVVSLSLFSFQKKSPFDLKTSMERGKEVYITHCFSCHMEQGEGVEDIYPPIAKSDYLMADKNRSILLVLKGASGEMKVNGKTYNTEMIGLDLSAEEISDVLNYVRNSFGNTGEAITPDQVMTFMK